MRFLPKISGAVVALVLAGVACGGGGTPSASSKSSPAGKKYDAARWREFALTNEEFADHVQRVQAGIADCMSKAGFKYYPATVEQIELAQDNVRLDLPKYPREEYHKAFGYGITTRFDNKPKQIEMGEQNLKYYESLSDADKEAYDRNMWGEDPDMTFVWAFDDEDLTGLGGCTKKAVLGVFTPDQVDGSYVNPKDQFVENDPRIVKAVADWIKCMEAAGYEGYEDQDEIMEEFEERLGALLGEDDPEDLEGAKLAQLKKLQEEEIKASMADLACEYKHTDKAYEQVETEIFGRPISGTYRS